MSAASPRKRILILPGDGIGPEIMVQARRVVEWFAARRGLDIDLREELFGIPAWHAHGSVLRDETWSEIEAADAILFGAIGSPEYDAIPGVREGTGLLRMRVELNLFINLRPVRAFPALAAVSPLRPEVLDNTDLVIVRELTGGIYVGQPRGIETVDGVRRGVNTMTYSEPEIERIARAAFELARIRSGRLCSVDKSNVLEVSRLWREVVQTLHDTEYGDVALSHLYVDNAAMQLVRAPSQFDVLLMENLFGDILSDIGAAVAGSIGMLPSASLDAGNKGMYEPCHGSAPDIAGKGIANPLATILSVSMMLRYSFNQVAAADSIERAVSDVLDQGLRTGDIWSEGCSKVGTQAMGDAVVAALAKL